MVFVSVFCDNRVIIHFLFFKNWENYPDYDFSDFYVWKWAQDSTSVKWDEKSKDASHEEMFFKITLIICSLYIFKIEK